MKISLPQRLESFYQEVQREDFLQKRGLANEVPFFIFPYDPKEELTLRATIDRLMKRFAINVLHIDLFKLMVEQFREVGIEELFMMEEEEGTNELYDAMLPSLEPGTLAKIISDQSDGYEVILITRVGSVYPLIRVNNLLHNFGDHNLQIPLVIFYPGQYTQEGLMMFNRFPSQRYYRAFSFHEK
ncbi:BREX protein BrxB domain-containing protein [Marininema halotolerans]|uniref:DUF1788 domain-containing protein n=1 Tax=Marininema halotolerans TaxID=1155944 RepID=A0A1I6R3I7_9BACL|nr:BREX protein BrxB domain-containing protein [Marininema halotolerans]SFS59317.1 protein of unknown function [Marininema halotolerans]